LQYAFLIASGIVNARDRDFIAGRQLDDESDTQTHTQKRIENRFVDGCGHQLHPIGEGIDILLRPRNARTVELDSGAKDPSVAWFDGM
jgi:hypothetical protein